MSDIPERDEELIHREIFGTRPPARARFYVHGARDEAASVAAGYPCFEDKVFVEVRIPDSTDFVSHPATPSEIRQFKDAWAAFERARDWKQHPLELLPTVTPALLAGCKALGLFTIEQLASHTPDTAPWTKGDEGDRFPVLNGEIPPTLRALQTEARRYVAFANKPRMRLVNGELEAVNV